jgi:S1-C subfamily serine protease
VIRILQHVHSRAVTGTRPRTVALLASLLAAATCGCGENVAHIPSRSAAPPVPDGPPPTVVRVNGPDLDAGQIIGSGFVLSARRRLIVTAYHVVNGSRTVEVQGPHLHPRVQTARVVAAAPCEDIALLKIESGRGLEVIGPPTAPRRGLRVTALGWGKAGARHPWRRYVGAVKRVGTFIERAALARDQPPVSELFFTTAITEPGMSGGPFVDDQGRVVGMSVGRNVRDDISTAIPARRITQTLADFRRGKAAGWIGEGLILGPDSAEYHGVVVMGIPRELGVYEDKGVLVTRVNGRPVGDSLASWCRTVSDLRPGLARIEIVKELHGASQTIRAALNVAGTDW